MPSLEKKDLKGYAILWESTGNHTADGFPIVAQPVQIRVRWEEGNFEMIDPDGNQVRVDVILAAAQQIPLNSMLWEGSEEDLEEEGTGTGLTPLSDIYEVVTRSRASDLKGRHTRYEFGLRRYKDTLPQLES